MEEIGSVGAEESRLLNQLEEVFSNIRLAGQAEPSSIELGLKVLRSLRHQIYEDINQLQHEALILKVAKSLENDHPNIVRWLWNPRQTGGKNEPDLQGIDNQGLVIVSTEVTTSENPVGKIDTRMGETLEKMSTMLGSKYYVVVSKAMKRRAETKLSKLGYQIRILKFE